MNTTKNAPRFINDTQVKVTKEFAKNARIFGTAEYKLWKEIRQDCPNAEMVTKVIKKNPNKTVDTKNMTYENMALFIREQKDAEVLMAKFKKQIALSKVQTNPYRCVLAWFLAEFSGYDSYKIYFAEVNKKAAQKTDIFAVVKTSSEIISADDNDDFEFDAA